MELIMKSKEKLKEEIKILYNEGKKIYQSIYLLDENGKKLLIKNKIKIEELPDFRNSYNLWYTKTCYLIGEIIPHRLTDFVELYHKSNTKNQDLDSYCIYDALLGYIFRQGFDVIASPITAVEKMKQQLSILKSAESMVDSYFYKLKTELICNIFDSEIESAYELLKKKFLRAAGAVAGVVLEKHLENVLQEHLIKIGKKAPAISDYNDKLKSEGIIDVPEWRRIQLLGDLRNLCCHNKKEEPTESQVKDLIDGVKYTVSNIF